MSPIFSKNNTKKFLLARRTMVIGLLSICVLAAAVGTGIKLNENKKSFAAGVDSVSIILGQTIFGSNVEASVCLLADTAINLGDTGIWLKYDNTKLTPAATLTSKGVYDGPSDLSGSYTPMTWSLVAGRTDTYAMKAIFNSNPATAIPNSAASTNNTPGLFGTASFNIGSGTGSTNVTIDNSGTGVLKRPTNTPLTLTVINYVGNCTGYTPGGGTVVTPTLGIAPTTPITGTVGSALPTITLTGSNLAANTPATFTPAGGTVIPGFITNGIFTPTAPATISSGSLTGARNGVLNVTTPTGVAPLNISTNFSPAAVVSTPTLGIAPTTPITGTVGSALPTITLTGSNLAANTPATFTPAGGTVIPGFITNGIFTPTAPATISSGSLTGARNGVLNVTTPTGVAPLNISTNFSPAAVVSTTPQTGSVPGAVITITNNTNITTSSYSNSSQSSSVTSLPAQALTKTKNVANDDDTPDIVELPKTGGVRKNTMQIESETLPRTGGINQFQGIILMLIVLVTVFVMYRHSQKRNKLLFDRNLKIK
jgi:hypothetical protein